MSNSKMTADEYDKVFAAAHETGGAEVTHTYLNSQTGVEVERRLLEKCLDCDAAPGEPCYEQQLEQYYCPDPNCSQLYEMRYAAMNCVMHLESL